MVDRLAIRQVWEIQDQRCVGDVVVGWEGSNDRPSGLYLDTDCGAVVVEDGRRTEARCYCRCVDVVVLEVC